MNDKEYAKNILLKRYCNRCIYYLLTKAEDGYCELNFPTVSKPKEETCEKWRSELDYRAYIQEQLTLEKATGKSLKDVLKIIGYEDG